MPANLNTSAYTYVTYSTDSQTLSTGQNLSATEIQILGRKHAMEWAAYKQMVTAASPKKSWKALKTFLDEEDSGPRTNLPSLGSRPKDVARLSSGFFKKDNDSKSSMELTSMAFGPVPT